MFRTLIVVLLVLSMSSIIAAQTGQQGVGVGQQVSVEHESGDNGIYSKLRRYCRYYELDECSDGFSLFDVLGTVHHMITVDNPDEWYEKNKEENDTQDIDLS